MPGKSEHRLAAEVVSLRKRLAQCERTAERHRLAAEKARGEADQVRALLTELTRQQPIPHQQGRSVSRARKRPPTGSFAWDSQEAWVRTIAHELRQPLTAILNYTRACSRLVESGKAKPSDLLHALEQASHQAERAAEMIQQLRRVAVPARLQLAPVDPGQLCREALALLEHELHVAHVETQLHLPDTLPAVLADPFQVRLVLLNLLRNAVESLARTPDRERLIRISVRHDAGEIAVAVFDSGEGLSLAMVRNLFEPYRTTKPEGMGLGLAMCRAIIQAHGGRIWAKPHSTRGITFTFTLPLQPPT